jgi:lipid-A-disaccharide synthase
VVIPVVEAQRSLIERSLPAWPIKPLLVTGEEDKFRAFKLARAALAASGTVTLELALASAPMVVAYKVGAPTAAIMRGLITVPSVVLANLVLDERAVPELIQESCTPGNIASALAPLLDEGSARSRQLSALARVPARMRLAQGTPSEAAADVVLYYAEKGRGWPHPDLIGRQG